MNSEDDILLIVNEAKTQFLTKLLVGEGYTVKTYSNQEEGLKILKQQPFCLIIAAFREPLIDGIKICKTVRSNFVLRHIPIILLMDEKDPIDKIKAIYAGADDYIDKIYEGGEFLARVKASLVRMTRDLYANPLTKLPGNVSILKELEARIKNQECFAVCYLDLNRFKEFNDRYGFEIGDQVIRHTSLIIVKALEKLGSSSDFIGHIGGDDFILITTPECVEDICKRIIEEFDKTILDFYNDNDRRNGYIVAKSRAGQLHKVPLLSISIGIVSNRHRPITHIGQIIQIGNEVKNYAKTFDKSIYIPDRRRI